MEVRLKYNLVPLWISIILTIMGLALVLISGDRKSWFALILGLLCMVTSLVKAIKYRKTVIVFNDNGIWINDELQFYWYQIEHCYLAVRYGTGAGFPCLVVITKNNEHHEIDLYNHYSGGVFGWHFEELSEKINRVVNREICYMNDNDRIREKALKKNKY